MTSIRDFLEQAGFVKTKPATFYTFWAGLGAEDAPPLNTKDTLDLFGRAAWLFKVRRADRHGDHFRNTVLENYPAWRGSALPLLPKLKAKQAVTLVKDMADLGLKDPEFLEAWKLNTRASLHEVSNRELSWIIRAMGILKEPLTGDFGSALVSEIEKRCDAPDVKDRPNLQEAATIAWGLAMMDAGAANPLHESLCRKVLNGIQHAAPKKITKDNISSLRPIRDAVTWFELQEDFKFPQPRETSENASGYESQALVFLTRHGVENCVKGKATSAFGKIADLEAEFYRQPVNIEADGPSHRIRTYPDKGSEYSGATLLQTGLDVKVSGRPVVRIYSETYNAVGKKIPDFETIVDTHVLFSGVADAAKDGRPAGYELVLKPASRGGSFEMKKLTR